MEYSQIDVTQQRQILKGRIAGWEADHFGHEINLLAGHANNDEQTIETSQNSMRVLEASIVAARLKLEELGNSDDDSGA